MGKPGGDRAPSPLNPGDSATRQEVCHEGPPPRSQAGSISPGPTRFPPGAEERLVPAKSNVTPQTLSGRSVELISQVTKCFCAACLDPQCQSIRCTGCKKSVTMTGMTPFDANSPFEHINGQASTIGRKQSSEIYLRINLGETIEYASK